MTLGFHLLAYSLSIRSPDNFQPTYPPVISVTLTERSASGSIAHVSREEKGTVENTLSAAGSLKVGFHQFFIKTPVKTRPGTFRRAGRDNGRPSRTSSQHKLGNKELLTRTQLDSDGARASGTEEGTMSRKDVYCGLHVIG
ncbi:unnamed protein product, partial [Iphiclides podalirius]